jgi:hypothetical protein
MLLCDAGTPDRREIVAAYVKAPKRVWLNQERPAPVCQADSASSGDTTATPKT